MICPTLQSTSLVIRTSVRVCGYRHHSACVSYTRPPYLSIRPCMSHPTGVIFQARLLHTTKRAPIPNDAYSESSRRDSNVDPFLAPVALCSNCRYIVRGECDVHRQSYTVHCASDPSPSCRSSSSQSIFCVVRPMVVVAVMIVSLYSLLLLYRLVQA